VAGCSAVRPRNLLTRVRRPQVGELGEQITVGPYLILRHLPARKASAASFVSVRPLPGKDAGRVGS
jgi:hypothetical protein